MLWSEKYDDEYLAQASEDVAFKMRDALLEYEARIAELEAENNRFRLAIDACKRISEQGQKSLQTVSSLSVIIAEGSERNRQLVNELAQAQERIAELEGRAYSKGCQS